MVYVVIPKNQKHEIETLMKSFLEKANIINPVKQYVVLPMNLPCVKIVESPETPISDHQWIPIYILEGRKNIWICYEDVEGCPIEAIIDLMAENDVLPIRAFVTYIEHNAELLDPYAYNIVDIWNVHNFDLDNYVDIDDLIEDTLKHFNNAYRFEFKLYMLGIKEKVMKFYQ